MKQVTSSRTASIRGATGLFRPIALAVALAFALPAGPALANPVGPSVAAGAASFATQGGSLSIVNSPGTIINWQGFSIGAAEATRFIQQGTSSSVLNRVVGFDPSVILGTLSSNGRVFLINPSGILVGQAARIDVAGLVASTLNLSNQDFLAGRLNFMHNPLAVGVDNRGIITTPSGGSVYLVGANVTNSGVINSPQGDVILAAGQSVKIYDTGTPGVRVEIAAGENTAINLGDILAHSGQIGIYGAVLRNAGLVDADQAVRDASGRIVLRATRDVTLEAGSRISANGAQGGEIAVQSDTGTTLASGTIEARGTDAAAGKGGSIQLLGNRVGLLGASVDASGMKGGGTVLIGGDYQGKNTSVQNASATYMSADSIITADAITNGDGGKVVLWANDSTRAYGSIAARGGTKGGNGGFIETSGHWLDVADINVNAGAPRGKGGIWLLDPADVTITSSTSNGTFNGGNPDIFSPDLNVSTASVDVSTIMNSLNAGTDVTVTSANANLTGLGDITVGAAITWTPLPTNPATLTLNAVRDVKVSAATTATNGSMVLTAGRDVYVNAAVTTTDGNFTANAANDVIVTAAIEHTRGDVTLLADKDGTGVGTVVFTAPGTVTLNTGSTASIYYNPTSYDTPTVYAGNFTGPGTWNSYMWVFAQGNNKVYNGLTTASLSFVGDPTVGGAVTLKPGTADFDTKNASTGKTITYSGYSLDGVDANKFSLFYSDVPGAGTTTADITKLDTTVSGTRVYDATLSAAGADLTTVAALIAGDVVTVSGAGTVATKDVAANKAVTNGSLALADTDAGNYNLLAAGNTLSITKLDTTVSGTRVYDATLSAAGADLTTVAALIAGDVVTVSGAGTVATKDVAANKAVTNGSLALADTDAGNYNLLAAGNTLSITKLDTTVSGTRVYDATLSAAGADLTTVAVLIAGDVVTVSGAGTVATKDVAANKAVTNGSLALADTDAGNYNLLAAGNTLSITKLDTTVSGTRVYDATLSAAGADLTTVAALIAGDVVTVSGAGTVATKDVAANKAVTNGSLALADTDAGNYNLLAAGNTLSMTPAALSVVANPQTKLFGSPDPTLSYTVTGLVNNPALAIADTPTSVLTGTLTRTPGESALGGPYPITLGTLAANANYSLGFTPGVFTIIGAAAEPILVRRKWIRCPAHYHPITAKRI